VVPSLLCLLLFNKKLLPILLSFICYKYYHVSVQEILTQYD
jgi:hypothetical protein